MGLRTFVAGALVLALAGCGGGDPEAKASKTEVKKVAMDGALPRVAEGTPVPEALSDFRCEPDDPSTGSGRSEGQWSASGVVSNGTDRPVTFQVTVHVGPVDGQTAKAQTRRVSSVQQNGSVGFELDELDARSADGPCHVQVVALSTAEG
jgi:hypothetical protein